MAEAVKLKISSAVAAYIRPGATPDTKLAGIQAAPSLGPPERVTILFCLGRDADPVVKDAAKSEFAALPENIILTYSQSADAHPALLGELARTHGCNARIAESLLANHLLPPAAREYLKSLHPPPQAVVAEPEAELVVDEASDVSADLIDSLMEDTLPKDVDESGQAGNGSEFSGAEYGEVDEDGEEYLSKYKMIQIMGISEKIKMSLTGDKEWRAILVKDANKLVSGSVLKNPRITEGEVLKIIKMGVQSDEVIRIICANKEWIKNYQIRKALIECPKTPLANSLRYLSLLGEKDLSSYAKSRNISSVISTQAKRMLLAKQKKR